MEVTVAEFRKRLIEESEKKKILLSANIEITSACCFRCPHCYIENKVEGFMPLSSFERIITELKSLGCLYLTITGGEAILHPKFREMYMMAYNAGFIISLFSNGYYIDNVIDLLAIYKPYEVDITLYGIDNESYLQNTGVLAAEKIFANLDLLKKHNITFSLKAVVTKKLLPYMPQMYNIAKKYGVTFRSDLYIYLSKDKTALVERLTPKEIAATLLKNEQYVELERAALNERMQCNGELLYNCHPGETNIYITCDEHVKMCPFTNDDHSYSIKEYGKTIQMAREYLQKLGLELMNPNDKCYECTYFSTCRRCPERLFIETGSYYEPPCWMCETAKLIYDGIH